MKLSRIAKLGMLILIITSFSLLSCEEEDVADELVDRKEYAGLGNNDGAPVGNKLELPQGIEIIGDITGNFSFIYPDEYWTVKDEQAYTRNTAVETSHKQGSGGLVSVLFQLKNSKAQNVQVVFPAGMIIESVTEEYQNGLLVKKTSVSVPANSTLNVIIIMYCSNLDRSVSDSEAIYKWPIVTSNSEIQKLLNAVSKKKINWEEFLYEENGDYYEFETVIQSIVWSITDFGTGFNEDSKKLISNMPDSK